MSVFLRKAIFCVIVAIICYMAAKISKWLTEKLFSKNSMLVKNPRRAGTLKSVTANLLKVAIYFVAVITILTELGVSTTSLAAISGSVAVAIGLGAQNLVSDIIAGMFILVEEQFQVGDYITISGCSGTVESVTMRCTRLRNEDGTVYIVPNGSITTIINKCKEFINAIVDIGVDYDEDIDRVVAVLKDEMSIAFKEVSGLKEEPEVLGIVGLDDSAVTIRIVAKCDIKQNLPVEREIRIRVKRRFVKENISIPFPQRTLHIINEKG